MSITEVDTAEDAVIGAILLSGGRVVNELTLGPDDFNSVRAATVYGITERLRSHGRAADVVTIMAEAAKTPEESRLVDAGWLHHCMTSTGSVASAAFYAEIIRAASVRRRLRVAAMQVMEAADRPGEIDQAIDDSRAAVERAANIDITEAVPFGRTIDDTLSNLETPPVHMKSPWPMLDGMINGFAPGRLYIMGARPGVGKSVAALQIALELTRHGAVAFSSLEMTNGELQTRAIAQSLRINVGRLMMGRANADDWQKIARKRAAWIDLPLFIDDRSAVTMAQVKQHARNVNRQRKLAAVVVDYLQLISAPRGARMSRYELVSEISRELKLMAKELNVPVIALSQLNRETDGLPKLKDLRESGSLEQDADVVLFLHREMQEASQDLTMIVAKNRHGVCGSVDLTFLGQFSAITQPALEQEPEPNPMLGNPAIDFGAGD